MKKTVMFVCLYACVSVYLCVLSYTVSSLPILMNYSSFMFPINR